MATNPAVARPADEPAPSSAARPMLGGPVLTPEEERFLRGEATGDEAERALQLLVDRAAAAPDRVFFACEVPDDA